MPHAGGRVGRGLYFADMISKSEQYLGLHGDIVSAFWAPNCTWCILIALFA